MDGNSFRDIVVIHTAVTYQYLHEKPPPFRHHASLTVFLESAEYLFSPSTSSSEINAVISAEREREERQTHVHAGFLLITRSQIERQPWISPGTSVPGGRGGDRSTHCLSLFRGA